MINSNLQHHTKYYIMKNHHLSLLISAMPFAQCTPSKNSTKVTYQIPLNSIIASSLNTCSNITEKPIQILKY
ncbi:hypothetical protein SAMN05421856_102237 [Chryseobacterium taichungense]|uniref:Uncharacterized protein n=1 Tax=Chryseobacterium taichungense TaxID=295069 RepID=A0A1H7X7V7_9FLAO|nr:hypothetical protein SAMN05421856_102237 [Chryseobacterium taichungense]